MTTPSLCPNCGAQLGDLTPPACPQCGAAIGPEETIDTDAPSPASPQVGERVRYFGDYELLDEIARGGMGVVYKARQVSLNRIVALKMILAGQLADQQAVQRFHTEAEAAANLDHPGIVPIYEVEAAANLDHPGIVPIYEVGEHDGQHYFSMGFIEGQSLATRLADGPLPPEEAAQIARKVAAAVAYAHERGVVHRDLKPSNILIDPDGEPRITDFGLAKRTDVDRDLTETGQILGTPGYMPPEQATGDVKQVRETSDVYSLGAVLYCLLTGRPPFQSANVMDTLMQVIEKEPVALRELNASVPVDLETVCLKCLEKESKRRYPTAQELADELQRFSDGKPVLARPLGRTARTWRWCKRNPVVASLLATVTVSLIAAIVFGTLAYCRAERLERLLYASHIASALHEWEAGRAEAAWDHFNACRADYRGWEYDYVYTQLTRGQVAVHGHKYHVRSVAFSPESNHLASAGDDHTVRVWDTDSRQQLLLIQVSEGSVWCDDVAFKIDTDRLVPTSLAFTPDGHQIVGAGGDFHMHLGRVTIWDAEDGHEVLSFPGHQGGINDVAISPDGTWIVTGGSDRMVRLWDADTGKAIRTFAGHGMFVECVDFSPDGQRIASGGLDKSIRIWDATTGGEIRRLVGHEGSVHSISFSRDGSTIASAGDIPVMGEEDQGLRLWELDLVANPLTFQAHTMLVETVAFAADAEHLVSSGADGVKTWDASTGRMLLKVSDERGACAVSPSGDRIAVRDFSLVRLLDAQTANELLTVKHEKRPGTTIDPRVSCVAFGPNGQQFATARQNEYDDTVRVWDAESGKEVLRLKNPGKDVYGLTFSPNGKRLLTDHEGGKFRLWDLDRRKVLFTVQGYKGGVRSIAFSGDGARIATGGADDAIRIWNASTGALIRTLRGHNESVMAVAFTADGKRIVSGSFDQTVKLWDIESGYETLTLDVGDGWVNSVAISPDGQRIVSGSGDLTVKVWDAETATLPVSPEPYKGPPLAIAPFDAENAKKHQQVSADYLGVAAEVTNSIGMKLVLIPPGEFFMGSPVHPVGQKKPNAFGLYDMHGHVWEWCQDWFGDSYFKESPLADPQGPQQAYPRVIRGGSWANGREVGNFRSAHRGWDDPVNRVNFTGFRVAAVAAGK